MKNAKEELTRVGIIDKNGELQPGIWRNSSWQELHITINPIKIRLVELDDAQRNFYIDINNAPPWAEPIVKYIEENYGEIQR